jgi:hypothetical protein
MKTTNRHEWEDNRINESLSSFGIDRSCEGNDSVRLRFRMCEANVVREIAALSVGNCRRVSIPKSFLSPISFRKEIGNEKSHPTTL